MFNIGDAVEILLSDATAWQPATVTRVHEVSDFVRLHYPEAASYDVRSFRNGWPYTVDEKHIRPDSTPTPQGWERV